jgi:hypothetical protein
MNYFNSTTFIRLGLPAVCVTAFCLRALAARGELWLDEIWSIVMVRQLITSPLEIITELRHDNNHFLNSLWIYLQPSDALDFDYRLLAVISGTLSVMLAMAIGRRSGNSTMWVAAVIFSTSYLLVHYSSEARGYGPLCFAVLLAVWSDRNIQAHRLLFWEILYCLSCLLGFLAHAAFIQFWLPSVLAAGWSLMMTNRQLSVGTRLSRSVAPLIFRVLLPGSFFLWLWWVNLSRMQIGGGSEVRYLNVILQTMSAAVGGPLDQNLAPAGALMMLVLLILIVRFQIQQNPKDALILVGSAVVVPAALLFVMKRQDIYPRYFLIGVVLFQLALSQWLGSLIVHAAGNTSISRRISGVVIFTGFTIANLSADLRLINLQRGHYQDALEWIAGYQDSQADQTSEKHAGDELIHLATDHPFRHGLPLNYFVSRTSLNGRLELAEQPSGLTDWILTHDLQSATSPPAEIDIKTSGHFALKRTFRRAPLSGWDLMLYKREKASLVE